MNLFEHVAVAFSMVLSFGVVRLLDGLRPALVPGRRYWVHALWLVQKLLNQAFYWWGFLSFREGVAWTVASFLWILLVPGLLFLQATALVTTNPSAVDSWRDHFFGIRSWFFSVDVVLILHSVTTSSFLRAFPWCTRCVPFRPWASQSRSWAPRPRALASMRRSPLRRLLFSRSV